MALCDPEVPVVLVEIEEFCREKLRSCGVREDWVDMICEDEDLATELKRSFDGLPNLKTYLPDESKLLHALHFCAPGDVKIVIVGHDPVPNEELATGLAFSFPKGTVEGDYKEEGCSGHTLYLIHEALSRAGLLELDDENTCCHEEWARNGVLLWNAALTVPYGDYDEKVSRDEHINHWESFTKLLLQKLNKSNEERCYFFWGDNAKRIVELLIDSGSFAEEDKCDYKCERVECKHRVFESHHPTWPRDDTNDYLQKAEHQFTIGNNIFPGIFNLKKETAEEQREGEQLNEGE